MREHKYPVQIKANRPCGCLTGAVSEINFGSDQIRIILHLLAVIIWLGGQIVMLGLLPVLRNAGADIPAAAARAWSRIAWPAFAVAVVTGIWNILAVDLGNVSSGYNAIFGIKMLLVVITGLAAALHQSTDKPALKGLTGALGFIAALLAMIFGVLMGHGG